MNRIVLFLLISFTNPLVSQELENRFYIYWGYNRSTYTKSNIHLEGEGYNIDIKKVDARDKPEELSWVYLNPGLFSIPQFNIRGGYRVNEKLSISVGYDHMKYVIKHDQTCLVSGVIQDAESSEYIGTYDNTPVLITRDFLVFEHTDGLNYIAPEIDRVFNVWTSQNGDWNFNCSTGGGIGILFPRTDAWVLGYRGPDIWNLAGFGISGHIHTTLEFRNRFFLQPSFKTGYINMPKIQTTGLPGAWAKQQFGFFEWFWTLGYRFNLKKENR